MSSPFQAPTITDDDIRRGCRLLGLPETAFHGAAGADPRVAVLKHNETLDVAACPGSGKTTLLVAKLAILADKWNYSTRGICVLSHTNVARDEIEKRLSACSAGQALLGYPHFIGTIHGFVNEFLAMPWLRALGYPIKAVDTEIAIHKRWNALKPGTQYYLKEKIRCSPTELVAEQIDFSVGDISIGKGKKLGHASPTYCEIVAVCKKSAEEGYFCHDEMFVWARHLLDTHPEMIPVIRDRFPMVFIDESQDNDEEQASLLHRLFCDGASPAICQRFGDPNQAIFNSVDTDAPTAAAYEFPRAAITKDLPNSHRFNQRLADIADPFGLSPYGLKGEGPKKPLASNAANAAHTIYLFKDQPGAEQVLRHYGDLLLETFSDKELREGVFRVVGQVTKKREDKKFPAHVGHYWPSYEHALSKADPRPSTFADCISVGLERARRAGVTFACTQKIGDGFLELLRRAKAKLELPQRLNRHQQVCELLETNPTDLNEYQELVTSISLMQSLTKQEWDGGMRAKLQFFAEHLCGTPLPMAATKFLEWPVAGVAAAGAPAEEKQHPNIYRHKPAAREALIQIGSIHSVKGETHTATLVVETFYNAFNIDSIKEWLLGTKKGAKRGKNVKTINSRLKLQYVAMTRPSYLICIAMHRSAFETAGALDAAKVALLQGRGWTVREI